MKVFLPTLTKGEIYLCGSINVVGEVVHTILLPDDRATDCWSDQMDWAQSLGGDLLTRAELVIAYEQYRYLFKESAYWSTTIDHCSGWAWWQSFVDGTQNADSQEMLYRAQAVRRVQQ